MVIYIITEEDGQYMTTTRCFNSNNILEIYRYALRKQFGVSITRKGELMLSYKRRFHPMHWILAEGPGWISTPVRRLNLPT